MRRQALGASGVELSAIGLGGVWLGAAAGEVLAASRNAGVNWIDTAEAYGDTENERDLGNALRASPEMMIASKVSPSRSPLTRDGVHRACRASLQRLRRDTLDVYFVHWPEGDVPLGETWSAMAELVEQGLVRAIGLSNYAVSEVREAHAIRPVDIVQEGLSLIDHLDARQHFAACGAAGITGVVYEPLANALLTGAMTADSDTEWVKEWPEVYERLFVPGRFERSLDVATRLEALARAWGYSAAQLAIAWCLHQPGAHLALAGTKNPKHARTNAQAADISLTGEPLAQLDALIPFGPSFA